MTKQTELARAEDEAADWAVLLADDPDDIEQRKKFNAWLEAKPLHAEVWRRTRRACDGLEQLPPLTRGRWPQQVPDKPQQRFAVKAAAGSGKLPGGLESRDIGSASMRTLRWKKPVAGMAAVACLLVLLIPRLSLWLSADYLSATGEQQTHVLPDRSKLILAPESALSITFTGEQRIVRLLKGTAYFEVQADAGRPFRVTAGGTHTTVLGTAFAISKSAHGVVVGVAHGHVRIEDHHISPRVAETLVAGEQLSISSERGVNLTRVEPEDVARWRKNELIARNLPVAEVVEVFRHYYNGVILVTEPLASQQVTGLYRLDDPVATLQEMAAAHGATALQISPWLLVLSQ